MNKDIIRPDFPGTAPGLGALRNSDPVSRKIRFGRQNFSRVSNSQKY